MTARHFKVGKIVKLEETALNTNFGLAIKSGCYVSAKSTSYSLLLIKENKLKIIEHRLGHHFNLVCSVTTISNEVVEIYINAEDLIHITEYEEMYESLDEIMGDLELITKNGKNDM